MSRMMGPPTLPVARPAMRLTVQVLPLAAEHAHGPLRAQAMADMKGRKFALPVQLQHTFRQVWDQIETRYKKNYLSPQQASAFTIYKLQDAYDCDLDVDDTVESIFAGETDPTMRMIKVVPSFTHRDFSVPVTSNLRPASAQKRAQGAVGERANKRRRIEQSQLHDIREESNPLRDQPMPTTESEHSGEDTSDDAINGAHAPNRSSRSHTGGSLVYVNGGQTGEAEFGPSVKEESPELGLPPRQPTPEVARVAPIVRKPSVTARKETPRKPRPKKAVARSSTPHRSLSVVPQTQEKTPVLETQEKPPPPQDTLQQVEDVTHSDNALPQPDDEPEPLIDTATDAAILRSPESTPSQNQHVSSREVSKRRDIYDVPSSPEFVAQKTRPKMKIATYGRSPKAIQNEVDLINSSRRLSAQAQQRTPAQRRPTRTLLDKAHAFRLPHSDEIESTPQEEDALKSSNGPQNGVATPAKATPVKTPKPGDLKRPTVALQSIGKPLKASPAKGSPRSMVGPVDKGTPHIIDPAVRARIESPRQQTSSPLVPKPQAPRQSSVRSSASAQSSRAPESPSLNHQTTTAEPATATEEARSIDKVESFHPRTVTPTIARLSTQPSVSRATPQKTPIPLPANVRTTLSKSTPTPSNGTTSDAEGFKKPALKQHSSASDSATKSLARGPAKAKEIKITAGLTSETPKKRGRPKKEPIAKPAGIENTPAPKKRGRPPKSATISSAAAPEPAAKSDSVERAQVEAANGTSPKSSSQTQHKSDAIVISSAEPESSDYDEEEEVSQDAPGPATNGVSAHDEPQSNAGDLARQPQRASQDDVEPSESNGEPQAPVQEEVSRKSPVNGAESSEQPKSTQKTTPWNTDSWNFGNIAAANGPAKEPLSNQEANAHITSSSHALWNGNMEITPENGSAREEENKSQSASPAASNRSSPALTRRPARFLSHSPTLEGSDAEEDESEEASASPSKATTPQVAAADEASDSDSDSDSNSDSSSSSESDTEMPDAPQSQPQPSTQNLASSPPQPLTQVPKSTPMVPETSQPTPSEPRTSQIYQKTPIPLPPSSQIPSTATPTLARRTTAKPPASKTNTPQRPPIRPHNSRFSGLKDQLDVVNRLTSKNGKMGAPLDVRTMDLQKLVAPKKKPVVGGIGVGLLGREESSDDEEEESESSSDSD
ncbi:hypothetical protein NX059_007164 [Plenodomus lindquistii]|nr:hypothetical protein NX059_007164 [Plenodomus lindquistii]